jgi:hypothetical protein
MSITAAYTKALDDAAVIALRSVVTNNPSTSVAELRELVTNHPALGDLTLSSLLGEGAEPAKAAKPKAAKPKAMKPKAPRSKTAKPKTAKPVAAPAAAGPKPATKRGKSREGWDTQTAEGRAELDAAVIDALAAFGGIGVSAEAIRARLGATPAQLRSAFARHIEAGRVSAKGKARGTRYSLE